VAAGQQLFMYYGRLTALETLQHFGFAEEAQLAYEAARPRGGSPVDTEDGEEGSDDGSEEESEEDGESASDDETLDSSEMWEREAAALGDALSAYVRAREVRTAKRRRVEQGTGNLDDDGRA
jgi:hypothetical protein